ncbi:MAG: glycosyltransferase family 2 protein [Candidatus Aenigmarchaeota archaeon]|nr:glycosyltransferase family 2 protein [Candidatus Aenigmarchaeota archaeon]
MDSVFIVIPAFNEEKSIVGVIKDLFSRNYRNVVVVDDGSSDRTAEFAAEAGAEVLVHPINRGQGAGLRTGTDYALSKGADIIVHFDADGQMRAEDIASLVKPLKSGKAEVSFGSRFMAKKSNMPIVRKFLLRFGFKTFMRIMYGVSMSDPQSGFRAMTAGAARQIHITQRGMAHCSEIIEEVHRKKIPFIEVPVVIRYTEYSLKHGQSNLDGFRIVARLVWRKLLK